MNKPLGKAHEARLTRHRAQGKIHAKAVQGRFNTARWVMVWLTQIIFYGLCWLNWDSADGRRQAVLFDIPGQKLYVFDLILWPQDALILAFVLIIAATALFLVTALAGRLFCGFACPQTVYTSIFTWIEARIEGDHLARRKLDASPSHPRKLLRKAVKHTLWSIVAGWTAITFVGYFTPIRELLPALAQLNISPWETFWLIFYAVFTYVQAGLAREAVCQHMCPYSRFQGVMFDPATRNVAYDRRRGEPRGQKQQDGKCIDCAICVQVCPTGIDIRDGLQYQCINCGLCIDACDEVMDKVGYPHGLIRYSTQNAIDGKSTRVLRPRIFVYGTLLLGLCIAWGWGVTHRSELIAEVLRDRNALYRETFDTVENDYTLKLINKSQETRRFRISLEQEGSGLRLAGNELVEAGPEQVLPVTLSVIASDGIGGRREVSFVVESEDGRERRVIKSSFFGPRQ